MLEQDAEKKGEKIEEGVSLGVIKKFLAFLRLIHDRPSTASFFVFTATSAPKVRFSSGTKANSLDDEEEDEEEDEDPRDEVELLAMRVRDTETEICAAPDLKLLKRARIKYLRRLEVARVEQTE
ncbi:hypothetical protein F443_06498 [Phytophthora nicotianae P1569]|uniref:Uncharacterized protein n=1 Tax=Phytophthora nicotianae P1569 TaxID=1317065 RepID=V9FF41_PHYNI|nr:hypothetical protein F443_06498 [Phytophthora nicotianae P1569]